jgi:hypothetical protein
LAEQTASDNTPRSAAAILERNFVFMKDLCLTAQISPQNAAEVVTGRSGSCQGIVMGRRIRLL